MCPSVLYPPSPPFPPTPVQADVIVNTTDSGLHLSFGAVSSSILAKAGQALQHECRTKYPGGVMVGDVACTQGHGLQCQAVYHVTLPHWSANSKQVGLAVFAYECIGLGQA